MRLILCLFILVNAAYIIKSTLIVKHKWNYFDYDWVNDWQKNYYVKNKFYIPENIVPRDVAQSPDNRIFLTVVKNKGVPASLNVVSDEIGPSGPLLKPYPNWNWHKAHPDHRCEGIVSTYRVAIDDCNRLWVVDNGLIDGKHVCDEKLMAFNLTTDRLIFKTKIPENLARNETGFGKLSTPIVETRKECASTTVYIADSLGNALIVWDDGKMYRLEGEIFQPEKNYANFTVHNQNFKSSTGISGMALSPKICPTGDSLDNCPQEPERYLYFRPMSSISMFGANTKSLRGFSYPKFPYFAGIDVLENQAVAQAFSADGILFYSTTGDTGIGCYNFRKPLTPTFFETILTDSRLEMIGGMKIFESINNQTYEKEEYLIAMSNPVQIIMTGTFNTNEINFRIFTASVNELIAGTICDTF